MCATVVSTSLADRARSLVISVPGPPFTLQACRQGDRQARQQAGKARQGVRRVQALRHAACGPQCDPRSITPHLLQHPDQHPERRSGGSDVQDRCGEGVQPVSLLPSLNPLNPFGMGPPSPLARSPWPKKKLAVASGVYDAPHAVAVDCRCGPLWTAVDAPADVDACACEAAVEDAPQPLRDARSTRHVTLHPPHPLSAPSPLPIPSHIVTGEVAACRIAGSLWARVRIGCERLAVFRYAFCVMRFALGPCIEAL
jgi:hypothetical protein